MEIKYLVLTSRYVFAGLDRKQMISKISALKELNIAYEVYQEVEIKKVELRKIKI